MRQVLRTVPYLLRLRARVPSRSPQDLPFLSAMAAESVPIHISRKWKTSTYLLSLQLPLKRLLTRMQSAEAIDAFLVLLAYFLLFADFRFLFTRELEGSVCFEAEQEMPREYSPFGVTTTFSGSCDVFGATGRLMFD